MRGQRDCVASARRAAAALVLLASALTACSSSPEPQAEPWVPRAPAAAEAAAGPDAASDPVALPGWWSPVLPLPPNASVVAVRKRACTVTFLDWGTDALLAAADLELEAEARGLETHLVSSVSDVDQQTEQVSELDLMDEVVLAPVVTHVVVLRMRRAAVADEPAVDASLVLTSRGDGGVIGEYALGDGC